MVGSMTIIDYSRREYCKDINKAITPTPTKVVPDVIAKNIFSCNCCNNCEFLREREIFFIEEHFNSKVECQIFSFKRLRLGTEVTIILDMPPLYKTKSHREELINRLDNSCCPYKKVLKSYIKKSSTFSILEFLHIRYQIHNKELVPDYIKNNTNILIMNYSYYRKGYSDRVLFKSLMYEYFLYLMGKDKMYIDTNELIKYVHDVFDED